MFTPHKHALSVTQGGRKVDYLRPKLQTRTPVIALIIMMMMMVMVMIIIIITKICNAPTRRPKALNEHNT